MKKINEKQRKEIYDSTEKMIKKIKESISEIENAKIYLKDLCEKANLDTYYTWSIEERLNESEIRLKMSLIRIEEFREEADRFNLSTSGFY